jgi:hypothetical protein
MNESIVRWTLLNNLGFLGKVLEFPIASKVGQEITTDYGRIDFILEDRLRKQLVVELETVLDTALKLQYCFSQVTAYKNVRFSDDTDYCILYASETPRANQTRVREFGTEHGVIIRTYPLGKVQELYTCTVERLSQSFGLALPQPRNYTICYLRWLNKILKPFSESGRTCLTKVEMAKHFRSHTSTNFKCYMRLALDFEMIEPYGQQFVLTDCGRQYIDNFNPNVLVTPPASLPSLDLTSEQKRLLLRVLTNGNWTVHKVNIYWFLKFVEVTSGEWIPNRREFALEKLDMLKGLFGVSYKMRTMQELLNFTYNFCSELELVERIRTGGDYDRLYLTPLGVEVSNIFGLDMQAKRSRLNLSFKYLE